MNGEGMFFCSSNASYSAPLCEFRDGMNMSIFNNGYFQHRMKSRCLLNELDGKTHLINSKLYSITKYQNHLQNIVHSGNIICIVS